jgi:hypothetical protein
MSSTNLSRKTMRCCAGNRAAADHTARTCCRAACYFFGRTLPIRKPRFCGFEIHIPPQRASPELQTAAALVIAHQVHRDLHQPGNRGCVAAKIVERAIRLARSNPA